jgi:hypothetical protein
VSVQNETQVELKNISSVLQHIGDPVLAFVPTGQFVHAVAPETRENEPAGHDTQTLAPVTPVYDPAEQFAHAVAPAAAY